MNECASIILRWVVVIAFGYCLIVIRRSPAEIPYGFNFKSRRWTIIYICMVLFALAFTVKDLILAGESTPIGRPGLKGGGGCCDCLYLIYLWSGVLVGALVIYLLKRILRRRLKGLVMVFGLLCFWPALATIIAVFREMARQA